jgi:hypothetical protein
MGTPCNPVDPKNDMGSCNSMPCPTGQTCIDIGSDAGPQCFLTCDPNNQGSCPCDRACGPLTGPDGGPAGGGCFPENTVGERCNSTFGTGGCAQNLICFSSAGTTNSYCLPFCKTNADCPMHTGCVQIIEQLADGGTMPVGMACAYDYGPTGKAIGSACGATDMCISDSLCAPGGDAGTSCLPQCDGPGAMCATGTCTAVVEGTSTIGYVCK